jgi:hypothetical protein
MTASQRFDLGHLARGERFAGQFVEMHQHLPRIVMMIQPQRVHMVTKEIVELGDPLERMGAAQHMGQLFGKEQITELAPVAATAQGIQLFQHIERPDAENLVNIVQHKDNPIARFLAKPIDVALEFAKDALLFGELDQFVVCRRLLQMAGDLGQRCLHQPP